MAEPLPCPCLRCRNERGEGQMGPFGIWLPPDALEMILCAICGNKRCPHSDDHRNECAGSNEPGQEGSRYGRAGGSNG